MLPGPEDLTTDTPAGAQKILLPHRPPPLGPLQPINIPLYNTNLADSVGPIRHTLENFALNTSVPIVTSTRPNTYPIIANNDQEIPNASSRPRKNPDPQLLSTGNMRGITKSKAIKTEISMEKTNCLTHMAPKTKYTLDPY